MKTIKINYDVNSGKMYDDNKVQLTSTNTPTFYACSMINVNVQLVTDSDLTPYTGIASDSSITSSIDLDFNLATDTMATVLSGDFNEPLSWNDFSETADQTLGQLSFNVYTGETKFLSNLGTNSQLTTTKLEIRVKDAIQNYFLEIYQMPVICKNILSDN